MGTTSPNSKLEIAGNLALGANQLKYGTSGSEDVGIIRNGAGQLKVTDGSAGNGKIGAASFLGSIYADVFGYNYGSNVEGASLGTSSGLWFANATNASGATIDGGITRISSGKLAIGNGSQGDYTGTFIAGNVGPIPTLPPKGLIN